jgi:hypothetical protein
MNLQLKKDLAPGYEKFFESNNLEIKTKKFSDFAALKDLVADGKKHLTELTPIQYIGDTKFDLSYHKCIRFLSIQEETLIKGIKRDENIESFKHLLNVYLDEVEYDYAYKAMPAYMKRRYIKGSVSFITSNFGHPEHSGSNCIHIHLVPTEIGQVAAVFTPGIVLSTGVTSEQVNAVLEKGEKVNVFAIPDKAKMVVIIVDRSKDTVDGILELAKEKASMANNPLLVFQGAISLYKGLFEPEEHFRGIMKLGINASVFFPKISDLERVKALLE